MVLMMAKYHEILLLDSPLSLLSIMKFFSYLDTTMILKIPNETFLRITRYLLQIFQKLTEFFFQIGSCVIFVDQSGNSPGNSCSFWKANFLFLLLFPSCATGESPFLHFISSFPLLPVFFSSLNDVQIKPRKSLVNLHRYKCDSFFNIPFLSLSFILLFSFPVFLFLFYFYLNFASRGQVVFDPGSVTFCPFLGLFQFPFQSLLLWLIHHH